MKRVYLMAHLSVMVLLAIFTQLAFVLFVPAYLIAIFAGFELFSRKPRPDDTRSRIRVLFLASVVQTLVFVVLAILEWATFVWLVELPWPSYGAVLTSFAVALVISLAIFSLMSAWKD